LANLIPPHGGELIERFVRDEQRGYFFTQARKLPTIMLDEFELSDIELLGVGALSPLEGFLREPDYDSVVDRMRLVNGTVWPIPITLSITEQEADLWQEGTDIALKAPDGTLVAVLHEPELYPYNRLVEARLVYGTNDPAHPGVARVLAQGPYHLGGRVSVLKLPVHTDFFPNRLTPAETRQEFRRRGWHQVVGFQTRAPIHRAHEYLLRCALEIVDGLLIHPLMGQLRSDELSPSVRMRCYQSLLGGYLPRDRVMLVINPASMRYAGPREAVFQAIIRQNYGCSHFIVGRDPTGVGTFYGSFDAQRIFSRFSRAELEVTALCFENPFYCRSCQGMATVKTCPHAPSERVSFSGTTVHQLLTEGKIPPPEFTRPEIAEVLKEAYVTAGTKA